MTNLSYFINVLQATSYRPTHPCVFRFRSIFWPWTVISVEYLAWYLRCRKGNFSNIAATICVADLLLAETFSNEKAKRKEETPLCVFKYKLFHQIII